MIAMALLLTACAVPAIEVVKKEVVVEKEVPVTVGKEVVVEVETSTSPTFTFLHKGEGRRYPYTRGYLEDEGGNIKAVIALLDSGAPEGFYTIQILLYGDVVAEFEYELR